MRLPASRPGKQISLGLQVRNRTAGIAAKWVSRGTPHFLEDPIGPGNLRCLTPAGNHRIPQPAAHANEVNGMRAGHVWRGRRIAPTHEAPRNGSNNKPHEPTSDRSTRCGSGPLIRVFRDIGHIFSSLYPSLAVLFLSRFAPAQGFVALRQAFVRRCQNCPVKGSRMRSSSLTLTS